MSAIGALRQLEKEKNKGPGKDGFKDILASLPKRILESGPVKGSIAFGKKAWKNSQRWMWYISTTLLITLVPLSIELLREEQTNEVVKELLGRGFTKPQLEGMGYAMPQESTLAAAPQEAQQ